MGGLKGRHVDLWREEDEEEENEKDMRLVKGRCIHGPVLGQLCRSGDALGEEDEVKIAEAGLGGTSGAGGVCDG